MVRGSFGVNDHDTGALLFLQQGPRNENKSFTMTPFILLRTLVLLSYYCLITF